MSAKFEALPCLIELSLVSIQNSQAGIYGLGLKHCAACIVQWRGRLEGIIGNLPAVLAARFTMATKEEANGPTKDAICKERRACMLILAVTSALSAPPTFLP